MNQADGEVRKLCAQCLGAYLRGLTLQRLGLFDQSAYPIGLAAFVTGVVNTLDHICAPTIGDDEGADSGAARGQLVDNAAV